MRGFPSGKIIRRGSCGPTHPEGAEEREEFPVATGQVLVTQCKVPQCERLNTGGGDMATSLRRGKSPSCTVGQIPSFHLYCT